MGEFVETSRQIICSDRMRKWYNMDGGRLAKEVANIAKVSVELTLEELLILLAVVAAAIRSSH